MFLYNKRTSIKFQDTVPFDSSASPQKNETAQRVIDSFKEKLKIAENT